jgi:hypothetical protein
VRGVATLLLQQPAKSGQNRIAFATVSVKSMQRQRSIPDHGSVYAVSGIGGLVTRNEQPGSGTNAGCAQRSALARRGRARQ